MIWSRLLSEAFEDHKAGRADAAEQKYRDVLAHCPNQPDALHCLGLIAHQNARHEEAIQLISEAIRFGPATAEMHANLGAAQYAAGTLSDSVQSFRRAAELDPAHAPTIRQLSQILAQLGKLDEAALYAKQAASLAPGTEAFTMLGHLRAARGQWSAAAEAYMRALQHDANSADALNGMGTAQEHLGNPAQAEQCFLQAVQQDATLGVAWTNLGLLLLKARKQQQALAALSRAVELAPGSSRALNGLGLVLHWMEKLDPAAMCYERAIAVDATCAEAMFNLSRLRMDQGRVVEAVACCEQSLRVDPDFVRAHSALLMQRMFLPDEDGTVLFAEARRWGERHADGLTAAAARHDHDPTPDRRLRVGYVSHFFMEHCQSHFTLPLIFSHDHGAFEIYCYHDGDHSDALTERLRGGADVWVNSRELTDEQLAGRIRADRIDILIDLSMHVSGNRLLAFARKPAPVQICWLAYPGTTGIAAMDYRISDPYLDPPGLQDHHYSEKTLRLTDTFWCYDPLDQERRVTLPPSSINGYITFGCLNNYCKIHPAVLKLWGKILRQVPRSRLMLLCAQGSHRETALTILKSEGVDPNRVSFVRYQPRADYLRLCQQIDVALDTFPYNGHTTSLDMFWMGVPVVTMMGKTVVGHGGLCLAMNLGLPELIARNEQEYEGITIQLAANRPLLASLRSSLRARLQQSPLMDAKRFARNMESAYRQAWQLWCEQVGV